MKLEKSFELIKLAHELQDSHEIQGVKDTLNVLYADENGKIDDEIVNATLSELGKIMESSKIRERDVKRGVMG